MAQLKRRHRGLKDGPRRKILSMLFGNNSGGDPASLLASAPLRLDAMGYSVIPTVGAVTPNFTRATTKTVVDSWGRQVTCLAGEVAFPGARRVENLILATEDLTDAAWTKINGGAGSAPVVTSGQTDPNGGSTAWRLQANRGGSAAGDYSVLRQSSARIGTGNLRTWYVKSNSGASQEIYIGAPAANQKVTVTTTWQRLSAPLLAGNSNFDIGSYGTAGNSTDSVDILLWHPQCENVTGQSVQTAGDYVSVGVQSAPAYHGSCVDGVKCFPTDLSGNPLTGMTTPLIELAATNLAFKSNEFTTAPWAMIVSPSITKNAIGVDGATSAWTVTVSQGDEYNQLAGIPLTAATYTRSIKIKKTTGAQSAYPVILVNSTTTHVAAATIDTTNGTGTIWTAYSGWTITTSSVRVTSWNADFWLVELTFLATATNWAIGYIGAMTTNVTKSSGSFADADVTGAAGTHVMQHLQLELGSKATSYIDNPNAAASVTRNADQLYYTGALIGNLKSIAVRGLKRDAGFSNAGWCVALSDGTINNYESVSLPSATQTRFLGVSGGVTQWDVIPAYTAGQLSNAAWSAAANDIKVAKDGVAQTQDTSATVPTVSRLEYGMVAGASQLNGYPGKVYGWTRNLSQSELNSVTV